MGLSPATEERVDGAASYEVELAGEGDALATGYQVEEPHFDMSGLWDSFPYGRVDMLIEGHDAEGREMCISQDKGLFKLHDFDGVEQEPADWPAALGRDAAYLLSPPRDQVEEYERDLPRACSSSMEDSVTGQRWSHNVLPGLAHPNHIFAFLSFADAFPNEPQAPEARRQARIFGDWFLRNAHPEEGV